MHFQSHRRIARYGRAGRAGLDAGTGGKGVLAFLLFLAFVFLFMALSASFLRNLSSRIAVSDASDSVTAEINSILAQILQENDFPADYFVSLEKNSQGEVMAISSNMSHINALSSQILDRVIGRTKEKTLTVAIPVGNLTGISLLMGRGPAVPVRIIILNSSRVAFDNQVVTAGINQSKHQITLHVIVDIDVLVPWGTESAQVRTEVLIADTVVVGQVPDTYFSLEDERIRGKNDGSTN